jgi:hypothetical protein
MIVDEYRKFIENIIGCETDLNIDEAIEILTELYVSI